MNTAIRIGGSKGHVLETIDAQSDPLFVQLYKSFRWKMIPNCTGRYTCRDHKLVSHLTPMQVIHQCTCICTTHAAGDDGDDGDDDELYISAVTCSSPACGGGSLKEYSFEFPNKEQRQDAIIVIPFDDENKQTGLISYIKEQQHKQMSSTISSSRSTSIISRSHHHFVHTLNAPSGFQRKLEAIGITLDDS